jgi:hypothetical protein
LGVKADLLMPTQPGLEAATEGVAQNELGLSYIPLDVPFLISAFHLLEKSLVIPRVGCHDHVSQNWLLTSNRSMSTGPANQP